MRAPCRIIPNSASNDLEFSAWIAIAKSNSSIILDNCNSHAKGSLDDPFYAAW